MTSAPIRDPLADHLLTPENAASTRSSISMTASRLRFPSPHTGKRSLDAVIEIVLTDRLLKEE